MNRHIRKLRARRGRRVNKWAHTLKHGRTKENNRHFVEYLRKNPTPSEIRICKYLDSLHIQYAFQKRRGPFVADFWFARKRLILEIDGSSHDGRKDYDLMRDKWCAANGWRVHRITNEQTKTIEAFLEAVPSIARKVEQMASVAVVRPVSEEEILRAQTERGGWTKNNWQHGAYLGRPLVDGKRR